MSERIVSHPFDDNGTRSKHSISLYPRQEVYVDLQVLISVPKHDDASSSRPCGNWNIDEVAEIFA